MSALENEPEILTVDDVCRILQVKRSWCYNDKSLPWFPVGRLKRIKRIDLQSYIETSRRDSLCVPEALETNSKYDDVMDFTVRTYAKLLIPLIVILLMRHCLSLLRSTTSKPHISKSRQTTLYLVPAEFSR